MLMSGYVRIHDNKTVRKITELDLLTRKLMILFATTLLSNVVRVSLIADLPLSPRYY